MSTQGNPHHGSHHPGASEPRAPYWKRAHRSWIFWVGLLATFAAIMVYVLSLDLVWRPRVQTEQPVPSASVGK